VAMRGDDEIYGCLFSYIDLEKRVRADDPLRVIREIPNAALAALTGELAELYSPIGRSSIPAKRLMRALQQIVINPLDQLPLRADRIEGLRQLFRWVCRAGH
jgi:hypothetical protein